MNQNLNPNIVVDCGANHRDGSKKIRVSISKKGSKYAVHRHIFFPQNGGTKVEFTGSLLDCINHVDQNYRHEDNKNQEVKRHDRRNYKRNI